MKKVAIVQSNYIPWKGFFDLIAAVDEFILYDDMQYTRRDWRNRNKIKTPQGLKWLTVPVRVECRYHQTIREMQIAGSDLAKDHWKALVQNYGRAANFCAREESRLAYADYHTARVTIGTLKTRINVWHVYSLCLQRTVITP